MLFLRAVGKVRMFPSSQREFTQIQRFIYIYKLERKCKVNQSSKNHLGGGFNNINVKLFLFSTRPKKWRKIQIKRYLGIKRYLRNIWGFPGGSEGKVSACNAGDPGLIPGLGRSPEEGNGNPLQHSCLENPMDRGAWRATVHGVTRVGHDWAHVHVNEMDIKCELGICCERGLHPIWMICSAEMWKRQIPWISSETPQLLQIARLS